MDSLVFLFFLPFGVLDFSFHLPWPLIFTIILNIIYLCSSLTSSSGEQSFRVSSSRIFQGPYHGDLCPNAKMYLDKVLPLKEGWVDYYQSCFVWSYTSSLPLVREPSARHNLNRTVHSSRALCFTIDQSLFFAQTQPLSVPSSFFNLSPTTNIHLTLWTSPNTASRCNNGVETRVWSEWWEYTLVFPERLRAASLYRLLSCGRCHNSVTGHVQRRMEVFTR